MTRALPAAATFNNERIRFWFPYHGNLRLGRPRPAFSKQSCWPRRPRLHLSISRCGPAPTNARPGRQKCACGPPLLCANQFAIPFRPRAAAASGHPAPLWPEARDLLGVQSRCSRSPALGLPRPQKIDW